jgi:predicted dehydrogenase
VPGARLVVIGLGPVTSYKYSRMIAKAIEAGTASSYCIVDLESQRHLVEQRRASLPVQPQAVLLLPDAEAAQLTNQIPAAFVEWLDDLVAGHRGPVKVFVATEPQAHEAYLRHCMARGLDTLTTKPLVVPMREGRFDVSEILSRTEAIAELATTSGASHAVLCLGRHHEVYEHGVRQPLQRVMDSHGTPVTSLHLKTASGVWNLPSEFLSRDDHPYRYGYGMLMHGAYHYVDVATRLLLLNRRSLPDEELTLRISAYAASPLDQERRIPDDLMRSLYGYDAPHGVLDAREPLGETDVVAALRLCTGDGRTLTLGTIGLEQTTPGMRSWAPFPTVPYNVNGRLHSTELDVRLSVAFGVTARVLKVPISGRVDAADLRARNVAHLTRRANAVLLGHQEFIAEHHLQRPYGDSFSYRAEGEIFRRWMAGQTTHSDIASHVPTAAVLQALGESIAADGREVVVALDYAEPEWPDAHLVDALA